MNGHEKPVGIDWTTMQPADFNDRKPVQLPGLKAGPVKVVAKEHSSGTPALFGDAPKPKAQRQPARPAAAPADTLF